MLKELYETFNILLHCIHMLDADEITGKTGARSQT